MSDSAVIHVAGAAGGKDEDLSLPLKRIHPPHEPVADVEVAAADADATAPLTATSAETVAAAARARIADAEAARQAHASLVEARARIVMQLLSGAPTGW